MQTSVRRHESGTQSIAGSCGGDCHSSTAERETLVCITPTNISLSQAGSLEALRSIRREHTAIADGCTFGIRNTSNSADTVDWCLAETIHATTLAQS